MAKVADSRTDARGSASRRGHAWATTWGPLAISFVAAATGIYSVVATTILTHESNELAIRAQELAERAYADSRPEAELTQSLTSISVTPSATVQGGVDLDMTVVLQNIGEEKMSGCHTRFQPVDEMLNPSLFLVSNVEIGGVSWSLSPDDNHVTRIVQAFDEHEMGNPVLLDVFFDCETPEFTSIGQIIRIDFATATVEYGSDVVPQRQSPFSLEQRNHYMGLG